MHRRSTMITPSETDADLDPEVSTSRENLTDSSGAHRKSMGPVVADETTKMSKLFPMIILAMELLFSFVEASSEIYSIYALGGFTSPMGQLEAIDLMIRYRYYGVMVVVPVGMVCDSYVGTYYPLIFFLWLLTALVGLHVVISLPVVLFTADKKLLMARTAFCIFSLYSIVEPLRIVVISRAIMESDYFRKPRNFYALLVSALNLGIGAAGTFVYFSLNSRYALCAVMFVNFGLMFIYTVFYTVIRRRLISHNPTATRNTMGVIEKAFVYIICQAFKYFDRYVLRKLIFKGRSGIYGDFRCFTLNQNTQTNAKALVATVVVTLPLVAALTMLVVTDALYYIQLSMFYYYPVDPYPLLSMKGYIFLLLFPLVEFCFFPAIKKCSRSEASSQLTMVGIGAMCVSLVMIWSLVVHKVSRDGNEFWYAFEPGAGHVAITNCLNEPLDVRSQFIDYITRERDGWFELAQFKTIHILNVPEGSSPFHFEFRSIKLSLYDEYYLPLEAGQPSWYVILPTGVFPFPPACFRRNRNHAVLAPSYYGPARVCVVCALTICTGYVQFKGSGEESIPVSARISAPPLTGRGTHDSIEYDKIMAKLIGEYTVTAFLGGAVYNNSMIRGLFSRAETYMVVVYENTEGKDYKYRADEDTIAKDLFLTDGSDLIKTYYVKTSPESPTVVAWMYPTVFFDALTDVVYLVSLWMFLFTNSPDQIRTTAFCFVKFISFPAYMYMDVNGAMVLRSLKPMVFFYLAATNCFFMIIYFSGILLFIHKLFKGKPKPHDSIEGTARKKLKSISMMPESSVVGKGE